MCLPDSEGRVPDSSLGFDLSVPDPEGRVPDTSLGFEMSVPDPEGRVGLVFSLSSHRHSYIGLICRIRKVARCPHNADHGF